MAAGADIRYSDVANYVGLAFRQDRVPRTNKVALAKATQRMTVADLLGVSSSRSAAAHRLAPRHPTRLRQEIVTSSVSSPDLLRADDALHEPPHNDFQDLCSSDDNVQTDQDINLRSAWTNRPQKRVSKKKKKGRRNPSSMLDESIARQTASSTQVEESGNASFDEWGSLTEEEPAPADVPSPSAGKSTRASSRSKGRSLSPKPPPEPEPPTEVDIFLAQVDKPESDMGVHELAALAEARRAVIRRLMIEKCGAARAAFRQMDLNGSGSISTQEFIDGVERMGLDWIKLTGINKPREFFKLFDVDRDHVVIFAELFPVEHRRERDENARVSTPDFLKRWRREEEFQIRAPEWQVKSPDQRISILLRNQNKHEESIQRRKWMQSSMRRLKGRGKSDAGCRELIALHLPRGTGPPDCQGIRTVSQIDIKKLRQGYMDQLQQPIRDLTKTMEGMRDLRREQKQVIDRLFKHVDVPVMAEIKPLVASMREMRNPGKHLGMTRGEVEGDSCNFGKDFGIARGEVKGTLLFTS